MTEIKNIIFDWDNTLFPFKEKYWELAHRQLFSEQLGPFTDQELNRFMEKYHEFDELLWPQVHQRKMTIEALREERLSLTIEYFDLKVDENYLTGFFKKFLNRLFELIEPDEQLIQNLKNLSKNYKLALLSNGGHVEQREKLRRSQVEKLFSVYISGETGYLKPDARAFKNVLTKENFQASETLMVGDLIEHDIKPAQELGMKTAYIGPEKETIADYEFTNIQDFFDSFIEKNGD